MKTSKTNGRPRITDGSDKSCQLSIRYSHFQNEAVRRKARLANMPVTSFIREASLKAEVKPRITTEQMGELRNLRSIGNNLNQLTKLAYKNGFAEIIRELTEIKLYLDIVIHKIQKP
jgi:hypothetical protein